MAGRENRNEHAVNHQADYQDEAVKHPVDEALDDHNASDAKAVTGINNWLRETGAPDDHNEFAAMSQAERKAVHGKLAETLREHVDPKDTQANWAYAYAARERLMDDVSDDNFAWTVAYQRSLIDGADADSLEFIYETAASDGVIDWDGLRALEGLNEAVKDHIAHAVIYQLTDPMIQDECQHDDNGVGALHDIGDILAEEFKNNIPPDRDTVQELEDYLDFLDYGRRNGYLCLGDSNDRRLPDGFRVGFAERFVENAADVVNHQSAALNGLDPNGMEAKHLGICQRLTTDANFAVMDWKSQLMKLDDDEPMTHQDWDRLESIERHASYAVRALHHATASNGRILARELPDDRD